MQEFKENYLNQNERMNPQLENMLKSNTSDLAKNPAFPKTDANGNPINFLELIAYKRFLEVIEKVKRYTNLPNVTGGGLGQLNSFLMQGVQFIQQVEAPHKLQLENLAVDLVVNEMEIPDGVFQFQCKLVPVGSINQDGFQKEVEEPKAEEVNQAFENESQELEIPADELFEDEKYKRRFINMLIQGSSKKGHYMFELVRRKINEYNPNLAETYGKVMSINDLIYWLLDDNTIKQMASNPSVMGGKEEIEESEDGSIIKTEAICFPISLHEIIKGVMEVFGTQGLPDDPQQAQLVINAVDSLSNETMDLRLGAIVWEKFVNAYPNMIFEEGNRYLQHYLFSRFCALPTDEFFRVSRLIMSDDPKGAKYLAKMVDEIQNDLQREDYEKNIDDINLDDLLGYKNGGKVSKGYNVFNYTDNVYATDEVFKTKKLANAFIKEFRNRFSRQGYYRDNQMNKIAIEDIDLLAIPTDFSPFRKFNGGGGVGKIIIETQPPQSLSVKQIRLAKEIANEVVKTGLDATIEYSSGTIDVKIIYGNKFNESLSTGRFRVFWSRTGDNKIQYLGVGVGHYDGYEIKRGWSNDLIINEVQNFVKKDKDYYDSRKYARGSDGGAIDLLAGGGMIDLFEDYENIPANVKSILDDYELEESDYDTLNDLQNELADVGYTFDFGLDYQPYGLRPIGVKITELQGYEDFDDSNKFDGGGEAEFDVYNWDDKMALINLGQIYEYAIKLDKMIKEDTDLEEWVKMKLTRIEQNIADVKHSLAGWEKYSSGGEIAKKQLLHIAKYSKDLIKMISNGSKLMSWQEGKLSVSAQSIDDIYHHLDYKMGNRAVDLENESEDEYGRGRQVIKKTPNKTKQVNKYVVKGYVYDGGEIWKETFDNIDEAYELAYQIQNGWTDDGTYYLITIYDEKGKKVATISDDKYFNELTELKLFKKVLLGADTKKERQVENEKLKGYKFNLQVRIADGGATGIFDKTFDSIFDVMDKMNTYYEEDYYAHINDEGLDYWEDKYSEIELSRNYIKGKYGWSFIKENGYWIAKNDYHNNHIVRIVNGKPTSDSSITKGALKQIMELEAQKKYSEKPKHNNSLSDMKKIWDKLSNNYKEREDIAFLIGYYGGLLSDIVPYKWNDLEKSTQIKIMNAYFGKTEEEKQKIINQTRKHHEALVKKHKTLRNLYGKKFVKGGGVGEPYDSMTKYQLEKNLQKLTDEWFEIRKSYSTENHPRQHEINKEKDKIITLLYGDNFSGVGQKFKYVDGGEVEDWMKSALYQLQAQEDNDNLQISYVNDDEFTCQDDDSNEYRVFKNEVIAEEVAVEEVESDISYQPENFDRDFLMDYIEVGDFFVDDFENSNYDYVKEIENESDENYPNRLIAELVDNGLITEKEGLTIDPTELSDEYSQDYIDLLNADQIGNDNGVQYFIDNFGEDEFFKIVIDNDLIDFDEASQNAVNMDGIAHFLARYDGETIYLDNNVVAYRTN